MKLKDMNTERVYTLPELKAEWKEFLNSDPWNHAMSFRIELFNILMATINGRNDCEVLGVTGPELSRFILRIHPYIGFYERG